MQEVMYVFHNIKEMRYEQRGVTMTSSMSPRFLRLVGVIEFNLYRSATEITICP